VAPINGPRVRGQCHGRSTGKRRSSRCTSTRNRYARTPSPFAHAGKVEIARQFRRVAVHNHSQSLFYNHRLATGIESSSLACTVGTLTSAESGLRGLAGLGRPWQRTSNPTRSCGTPSLQPVGPTTHWPAPCVGWPRRTARCCGPTSPLSRTGSRAPTRRDAQGSTSPRPSPGDRVARSRWRRSGSNQASRSPAPVMIPS
jgi:hypothetical protein